MDIEYSTFDFQDGTHCVFGLNITKKKGRVCINLFDLDENRNGPKIGDHLWELRNHILATAFTADEVHDFFKWSFTTGYTTSDITFFELNKQPCQLILSNMTALQFEQLPSSSFSVTRYSKEYSEREGKPIHESDLERELSMEPPKKPDDMFAVPCPQAKDGVFYCKPDYYLGNIHDEFEYMLVDTQQLIARIRQDDPKTLEHARYKFAGETPEGWMEVNSPEYPYKTGSFAVGEFIRTRNGLSPGLGITMTTGNAGLLVLADELQLPFIPIVIPKSSGAENIAVIKRQLGYANDWDGPSFDKHESEEGYALQATPVIMKSDRAELCTLNNNIWEASGKRYSRPTTLPPTNPNGPII